MSKINKVCSKCGKTIFVDEFESCCPLCGEFFEEIDNNKIYQRGATRISDSCADSLRDEIATKICYNCYDEKEDSKKIFSILPKTWFVGGLGILFGGIPTVFALALTILLCLLYPFVRVVNHIRYTLKFNKYLQDTAKNYKYKLTSEELSSIITRSKRIHGVNLGFIVSCIAIVAIIFCIVRFDLILGLFT